MIDNSINRAYARGRERAAYQRQYAADTKVKENMEQRITDLETEVTKLKRSMKRMESTLKVLFDQR